MTDIPDWAGKRACELLNAEAHKDGFTPEWEWPKSEGFYPARTVAKLVMQHETAPVDPDEEAVKRIIKAWSGIATFLSSEDLAAAVSQYKQEKANG